MILTLGFMMNLNRLAAVIKIYLLLAGSSLIEGPVSSHSVFAEATQFVKDNYPESEIIPLSHLKYKIRIELPLVEKREYNYYEVLFGCEGNMLRYDFVRSKAIKKT